MNAGDAVGISGCDRGQQERHADQFDEPDGDQDPQEGPPYARDSAPGSNHAQAHQALAEPRAPDALGEREIEKPKAMNAR